MDRIFADIKHALGIFVRSPGFTVASVGTLALGIEANRLCSLQSRRSAEAVALPRSKSHRYLYDVLWRGVVFCTARRLENYAVARCRLEATPN